MHFNKEESQMICSEMTNTFLFGEKPILEVRGVVSAPVSPVLSFL